MTKKEAIRALGELFITGIPGLEPSESTLNWIKKHQIGGIILFSHNYDTPGQIAELIHQIQDCRSERPLWISVDQEGGRVQRFKKGFTRIPSAAVIGNRTSPQGAFEIATILAQELKSVGINLNFCPVADILSQPKNPVIGDRAYGQNLQQVTRMCTAVLRGHLVAKVQPCVKHFPGHGDTLVDSHFALPKIHTPLSILKERELQPFIKAFKSQCSFVMIAHLFNTAVDSEFPASLSSIFIQNILRKELRFKKLILSDDLEMKAITAHYGAHEVPVLAIQAGCDLLIYRSQAATQTAHEGLVKALEKHQISTDRIAESIQRIRQVKTQCLLPYQPVAIADMSQSVGITEHSERIQQILDRKINDFKK